MRRRDPWRGAIEMGAAGRDAARPAATSQDFRFLPTPDTNAIAPRVAASIRNDRYSLNLRGDRSSSIAWRTDAARAAGWAGKTDGQSVGKMGRPSSIHQEIPAMML